MREHGFPAAVRAAQRFASLDDGEVTGEGGVELARTRAGVANGDERPGLEELGPVIDWRFSEEAAGKPRLAKVMTKTYCCVPGRWPDRRISGGAELA